MSARADARRELAALLEPALVGPDKPTQAVYHYQAGDFAGRTPVVVVASGAANHEPNGFGCDRTTFQLLVFVFVAYAVPGSGWTEEDTEDALDDIEALIAEVISANSRTDAWTKIEYAAPTDPAAVVIGGVEYRRELMTFDVQLF